VPQGPDARRDCAGVVGLRQAIATRATAALARLYSLRECRHAASPALQMAPEALARPGAPYKPDRGVDALAKGTTLPGERRLALGLVRCSISYKMSDGVH
jgi:hypothetical protein